MIDFIGIGAQKSGTSWIYACLYEHPQVCAPIKEIHFFSRSRFGKGKDWYEHHFRSCKENTIKGEFSTSYLYSKKGARHISSMYPDAKIVAVLRNPVDRAYSQYRNAIKAGEIRNSVTFREFVENDKTAIGQGLYSIQLQKYFDRFEKKNILVLIYEDSKNSPEDFIKRVYSFLGIDTAHIPNSLYARINVARTPHLVAVDRVMHRTAEFLRKIGLDKLVWLVHRSGLPDSIRVANTKKEKTSEEELIDISEGDRAALRADAEKLSVMLNRDLVSLWRL